MSSEQYRHSVTAIVVAHDGSRWLPDTLYALRSQTRRPEQVVGVDNDSRDRSGSLLVDEFGPQWVLKLPRGTGFGEAVTKALQHPAAASRTSALEVASSGGAEWIWLLHDDCAPEPTALEHLLAAADQNRYAAVLGPKLRDWVDRRVLLEAGVTIDGAGRRETGLERREFDQGQHDGIHEVLAVSTAGMLVRRDVWEALGGLAPELPLFRDDIDFGWRVNASGHRVLAVTAAVAYHAEAATRRRRRLTAVSEHPRRLDRRNALFVLFANLPAKLAAWAGIRNLFGGLIRALVFLLAKQPGNAADEMLAYATVVGKPFRVLRGRRRRRGGPRRSYHTMRKLMPPRWQGVRRFTDMVADFFGSKGPVEAGRHHAAGGPIAEDEELLEPRGGLLGRVLRHPGVLLFLVLTAVALVAERRLLTGGRLGGGALLPVSGNAVDLWRQYLAGWHAVGLGGDAPAPPYVMVMAMLATLFLGKTWVAMDVVLLGCVPLAGATAYVASRWLSHDVWVRVWAAATYALLPVAMGAVAAGRFGTAVAFVLLPLVGVHIARMMRLGRRKATRAAWGAGGLLAIVTAFVPLAWLLGVLLASVAHRFLGSTRPGLGRRLLIVLLVPPVLLLPWSIQLFTNPGLFFREAGLPTPNLTEVPGAVSLIFMQPGGPGMPPLWVVAGLLALGVAALGLPQRRVGALAGWAIALCGMVAGVVVTRLQVTPPSESSPAPGWSGMCMALAGAGVILAAAAGADHLVGSLRAGIQPAQPVPGYQPEVTGRGRGRRRGLLRRVRARALEVLNWRRWAAVGVTGLAAFTPLVAAGTWLYTGVQGPIDRTNPPVLPAFVAAQSATGAHPRTLVLRGSGEGHVTYTVLRASEPLLGSSEIAAPPGLTDHVASVVAGLASGRHSGEVAELASYGIQYVVMPAPLNEDLLRTLDANPRISRVSKLPYLAVWELQAPAARLRLVSGNESRTLASERVDADTQVPPGTGERRLVLAENADEGWHATLNGQALPETVADGWAQGFTLPPTGGELVISYSSPRDLLLWLQALLVLVVFVLALPGGGQEAADEEEQQPMSRRERRQRRRSRAAPRRARGHRAQRSGQVGPDRQPGPTDARDDTSDAPPHSRSEARRGEAR